MSQNFQEVHQNNYQDIELKPGIQHSSQKEQSSEQNQKQKIPKNEK